MLHLFLQFGSYFFPLFLKCFLKPHIILFSFLTPLFLLLTLFYLFDKFYFLYFFTLILFLLLLFLLSLPSQNHFFQLVISYLLFFSYNSLYLYIFINICSFAVDNMAVGGGYFADVGFVSWIILFCSGSTCTTAHRCGGWCDLQSVNQGEEPNKE